MALGIGRRAGASGNWHPRCGRRPRGGAGGRARRSRRPGRRTSRDAAELDRRVSQVRVLDPLHPLYGQQLAVGDRQAAKSALIVVRLPDGRERSIPRAATDLAYSHDPPPPRASRDAHISVRTLLPLANHVRIVLASRSGDGGDQAPAGPKCGGTGRNAGPTAAAMGPAASRDATPARATSGSPRAATTAALSADGGEPSC